MTTTATIDTHTAEEFRAAVERAAVFLSDAGRLRLTGEDARDLLNRLSTNLVDPDGAGRRGGRYGADQRPGTHR